MRHSRTPTWPNSSAALQFTWEGEAPAERQYHPDRNPGDKQAETRFKEVQTAYDVLSDKNKRAQYDRFGFSGVEGGMPGGGQGFPGGFHFNWGGGPGGSESADPAAAAEFLRQFGIDLGGLGGMGGMGGGPTAGRRAGGRKRRAPAEEAPASEVTVPFETAALGGSLPLKINEHEIKVKIPAGTEEGKTMRLREAGPNGEDLLIKIHVRPHPYFRREGNDLILDVPISLAEAVLGTKVEVPTLDGTRGTIRVPPGSSSGTRMRLRGRGINGGDQYIELKVIVPAQKDDRSRELIEEFARLNPQDPRADLPWS